MRTKKIKYKNTICDISFSYILTELLFLLFHIENNVLKSIVMMGVFYYCFKEYRSIKKDKRDRVIISIFSIIISIVLTLQNKISYSGNIHSGMLENQFYDFSIFDIARLGVLFICLYIVFLNLYSWFKNSKVSILDKDNEFTKKEQIKYFFKSSLFIFIPFFLYLIIYYPGFVAQDSLASILQGIDRIPLTNHHPVLYTKLIGFIMRVGYFIHSYNFGVFLCSLFQLSIMSLTLGYFILWLKKHNIKFIYISFVFLYFIASTLFASYSISMWKDPLFSCFLFLITLYLYDIVKSEGEILKNKYGIIIFLLLSILIAFFRNNGIYIIIGLFIVLLFVYKKLLLSFHISFFITIIGILLIQGPLYSKLGIVTQSVESYAVPLQQVARTIASDGRISESNLDFLNEILPIDKWKEKYSPMTVDPIKWEDEFNEEFFEENKTKFIKIWLEVLPDNLDTYIKAYLLDTYSFWSIGVQSDYGLVLSSIIPNGLELRHENVIKNITGLDLEKYVPSAKFIGSGTLFWITILSGFMLILLKKSKYIISLLPCILSFLTIFISSPVAFSLRYVFMVALTLPFIIILPFMVKNEQK